MLAYKAPVCQRTSVGAQGTTGRSRRLPLGCDGVSRDRSRNAASIPGSDTSHH